MKYPRRTLLITSIFICSFSYAQKGFVHVFNQSLVDSNKNEVKLHSVNLGGWLLWEGWIWGAGKGWIFNGFISQSTILKRIENRTSKSFAIAFQDSVHNKFITEEDFQALSSFGFNSIRLPINYRLLQTHENVSKTGFNNFNVLDNIIALCEKYKIYAILELHSAPGGQMPYFVSDPEGISLWKSNDNKDKTVDFWTAIAKRYANKKIIAGYDLLGEPKPPKASDLTDLYKRLIDSIRNYDQNHLLILEGTNFSQDFSFFSAPLDNNQIFSFHFYPWFISKKQQVVEMEKYDAFARKMGVPLWCGEWGEQGPDDLEYTIKLLRNKKYLFCGDAFWTWKKAEPNNNPSLNKITVSNDWKRMLENKKKQSDNSYEKIAYEFLLNAQYKNTSSNERLRKILTLN